MSRHHLTLNRRSRAIARRAALYRDAWRCQQCGQAGRLEVDHVQPLEDGGDVYDFGVPPMCWTLGLCGRVMVVVVLPFVWWLLSDRGVKPAGVVPGLDPPSD